MIQPSPNTEIRRLQALASYGILDTPPDDNYDAITQLAAQVCEAPVSLISFIDANRLWFKSSYGLNVQELPRQDLFCEYAIRQPGQLMEVTDARLDERFADSPLVTGAPNIVFYAGIPLTNADGHALGTLCVIDQVPRQLTKAQISALTILSRQVIMQTELCQHQHLLQNANAQLATLNETLQANNELLQAVVDNCPAGLVMWQAVREAGEIVDFRYQITNPVNSKLTGLSVDEMIGQTLITLFPDVKKSGLFDRLVTVVTSGEAQKYQRYDRFNQIDMWGDFMLTPLGDGVLFTIQDITRLKETEEQLRAHTENLQHLVSQRTVEVRQLSALQNAILQHDGLAIISTDTAGLIQTINPATEVMLGYSENELLGTSIIKLHDPIVLQKHARRLSRQLDTVVRPDFDLFKLASLTPSHESILLSRDGRRIPVLLTTTALWSPERKIEGYVGIATDISALKVAKAELKKKNQELNTFFEVALDLYCIADTSGKILKINRGWLTTMGYSAAELVHANHFDMVHPDDLAGTKEALRNIIPNQPIQNRINRFLRKDGTYRVIEWNAVSIGNLLYASARDITERQQAERQLRIVNQRLELATQAAKQGIWQYDIKQDLLTWDERLYQIHGHPVRPSGMKFQDYLTMIHPDDIEAFHRDAPPKEDDTIGNVVRVIAADGTVRYTETRAIQVRDKAGKPIRMVGVVWDITEQKQAEDAMRESEQRFREIADNVNDIFWIHQAGPLRLIYINKAYDRVFGRPAEGLYGNPSDFLDAIFEEDRAYAEAAFTEAYRNGQPLNLQCRLLGTNGLLRWLSIRTTVVRNPDGQPLRYIGIASDITSQKEKELVLHQTLTREQELNRLKTQFVSTASHEFRTPLATIQSSVDLIGLYIDLPEATAQAAIKRHLEIIGKEVNNFAGLLSDILTIGKIDEGKFTFSPQQIDVMELCRTIVATHFDGRKDNRHVLITRQGTAYPAFIDEKLLGHVLINLLTNAFKFSAHDTELHVAFNKTQLVITIRDRGIGIPADDQPHLFQTFYRARNATSIQGTGLGLSIARQFVELHGGHLTVESEEHKGTTVFISLPAKLHPVLADT